MSYIEENGNWAQSDVREVFETKGIIPSNANEAFAAMNLIGATAASYAENIGSTKPASIALKIFKNGSWTPVSVIVNYANGDNVQKSFAKAIAGVMTAEMIALASTSLLNPATAHFALAIGTITVGYFAANFISNTVGNIYDIWIGPEINKYIENNINVITSNYSVKDTIELDSYHGYLDANYKLVGDRDGVEFEYIKNTNTYKFNQNTDDRKKGRKKGTGNFK